MIDFRYHLVTIIAIFLALAIGIVVGTTALNGVVVTDLHRNVARLQADKNRLVSAGDHSAALLAQDQRFARLAEPTLIAGAVSGVRVTVVGLPGTTREAREAVGRLLVSAGAQVASEMGLSSRLASTADAPSVEQASQEAVPIGVSLSPGAGAVADASLVLAAALADRRPAGAVGPGSGEAIAGLVTSFSAAHLISLDLPVRSAAGAAVLVAPPGPLGPSNDGSTAGALASSLAEAFAGRVPTEVVGPVQAAAPAGVLTTLRSDPVTAGEVVTVDGAGTPAGDVASVLGLRQALNGLPAPYGVLPGETPFAPLEAPPSSPPAASPSSSPPAGVSRSPTATHSP